jgi:hypothetical protein
VPTQRTTDVRDVPPRPAAPAIRRQASRNQASVIRSQASGEPARVHGDRYLHDIAVVLAAPDARGHGQQPAVCAVPPHARRPADSVDGCRHGHSAERSGSARGLLRRDRREHPGSRARPPHQRGFERHASTIAHDTDSVPPAISPPPVTGRPLRRPPYCASAPTGCVPAATDGSAASTGQRGTGPVEPLTISSAPTSWSRGPSGSFSSRAMARRTASRVRSRGCCSTVVRSM